MPAPQWATAILILSTLPVLFEAAQPEPAIKRALQDGGQFDVVFTDVVMPGTMSGLDLAAWCQANIPAMAVIVATGYTTQHIDASVKGLSKPYSIETLLAELQYAVRVKRA